jgi:nucleotide-binding universal stress UspA family protein
MSPLQLLEDARVRSIFLPSDFSDASEVAFVHALKIALVAGAKLSLFHVDAGDDREWEDFPGVRETLERWKLLPAGSPRSAVARLGIDVRKVVASGRDPVRACLGYLDGHPAELIVLAVKNEEGRMRWLERSSGEPLARRAGEMALFLPEGVDGFVSRADGSVSLRNILIPVAGTPNPGPAIDAAARLIRNLGIPTGTVTLLHAGPESEMPATRPPSDTGWRWNREAREGEPVEVILDAVRRLAIDLVVMTTDGPDGFLDALRGTTSERLLRQARCPVANLPVGSMLG